MLMMTTSSSSTTLSTHQVAAAAKWLTNKMHCLHYWPNPWWWSWWQWYERDDADDDNDDDYDGHEDDQDEHDCHDHTVQLTNQITNRIHCLHYWPNPWWWYRSLSSWSWLWIWCSRHHKGKISLFSGDENYENVTCQLSLVHDMYETTRKMSHPAFLIFDISPENVILDISPENVTLDISPENPTMLAVNLLLFGSEIF